MKKPLFKIPEMGWGTEGWKVGKTMVIDHEEILRMDPNETEQKITIRFLEAQFSGIQILLDYINALNNPTSNRVKKKFMEETKKIELESTTLDQSEAIFGFLAYLMHHRSMLKTENEAVFKMQLAEMADKFMKLNNLAPPGYGYAQQRLKIPAEGPDTGSRGH